MNNATAGTRPQGRRNTHPLRCVTSLLLGAWGFAALPACGSDAPAGGGAQAGATSLLPGAMFGWTNVWEVHLRLTPEQWAAMEPRQREADRPWPRPGGGRSWLQGPEGGRNGVAAAFGIEFNYVRAQLEFGPYSFNDVGVRFKGNGTFLSSRDSLKRSFKIDLNEFVKGQRLAGLSQLNLHNSVRDPSSMNEAVAYRLFREAGVPAPRTAYAKVYVTVPGQHERRYFGLYVLVEDVGEAFVSERFGAPKGALFKPVTAHLFADLGNDWKSYNQTYDPKGNVPKEARERVMEFCKIASTADDTTFAAKLPEYVDLDNFARYLALTTWLSDLDGILGPGQNYYLFLHPGTNKFFFIPWDQDQTFGQFPRGTETQRENLSLLKPWTGENPFLERVFKVDAFRQAYWARLREFNDTLLRPERIHAQVDELARVLRAPIQEESPERLAAMNRAAAGERVEVSLGPAGSRGTLMKPIKSFVEARARSVSDQLAGKSNGETIRPGFGPPR